MPKIGVMFAAIMRGKTRKPPVAMT